MQRFYVFLLLLALMAPHNSHAQTATFESLSLPATNFWRGDSGIAAITPFTSGNFTFVNRHDTSSWGDFWSGWGYSATTDTVTASYVTNEMSAITGGGHNGSAIYGVSYLGWDSSMNRIHLNTPGTISGCYITNTTVAYRSMQNGDFAAKKFGGSTGNDPDYFRLDITGWFNGLPKNDTIHFYLADFRFTNNALDYILHTWTWMDLSSLGPVDSLTYNLVSSDNSSFGMNTPAYFCMDDGITETVVNPILVYPVPMRDQLILTNPTAEPLSFTLNGLSGQLLAQGLIPAGSSSTLLTDTWAAGIYTLRTQCGTSIHTTTLCK